MYFLTAGYELLNVPVFIVWNDSFEISHSIQNYNMEQISKCLIYFLKQAKSEFKTRKTLVCLVLSVDYIHTIGAMIFFAVTRNTTII